MEKTLKGINNACKVVAFLTLLLFMGFLVFREFFILFSAVLAFFLGINLVGFGVIFNLVLEIQKFNKSPQKTKKMMRDLFFEILHSLFISGASIGFTIFIVVLWYRGSL